MLKRRVRYRSRNKIRIFVKLKNQPFRGSRSVLKFYKILSKKKKRFFRKNYDYFLVKKYSLKTFAFRKKLKLIFRKLWQKRRRRNKKFSNTRFYFERRALAYRVFKLFRYKKFKKSALIK